MLKSPKEVDIALIKHRNQQPFEFHQGSKPFFMFCWHIFLATNLWNTVAHTGQTKSTYPKYNTHIGNTIRFQKTQYTIRKQDTLSEKNTLSENTIQFQKTHYFSIFQVSNKATGELMVFGFTCWHDSENRNENRRSLPYQWHAGHGHKPPLIKILSAPKG